MKIRPVGPKFPWGRHRDRKTDMTKICTLLGIYAAYGDNSAPNFRDNLSVPSSRVKKWICLLLFKTKKNC